MKKRYSNFGPILCLSVGIYCLYMLLLNSLWPLSIGSLLNNVGHWSKPWHILVIGLLPLYIGTMIFGTSVIGIYLGSNLQRVATRFFQTKPRYSTQCKNDTIHGVGKSPYQRDTKVG